MEIITSKNNPFIIKTTALSQKKYRDDSGLFIFEGRKLFCEAKAAKIPLKYVIATPDYYDKYSSDFNNYDIKLVSREVFSKISEEKNPEGIICIAPRIDFLHKYIKIYDNTNNITLNNNKNGCNNVKFIIYSLQDPGNFGTIIRSASAFGIGELICNFECADIYNQKTIRASMGAVFRQKITVCYDISEVIEKLKKEGYSVFAAAPDREAIKLHDLCINQKTCFIIGNEGHGIDEKIIKLCSASVFIPIENMTESLNASAAAAILLYKMYESVK